MKQNLIATVKTTKLEDDVRELEKTIEREFLEQFSRY